MLMGNDNNKEVIRVAPTVIVSHFGFDYNYDSDTDDEKKYLTYENKKFVKMKRPKREAHVYKLWRKAFIKALSCTVIINQFSLIHTKMQYFGRHMIN